jgi:alkanesulfonate monooxygenase SsuD/methylene tetrahydromethanopterin reductase-like flavin-dependent oxidoreductase (luciferase family)
MTNTPSIEFGYCPPSGDRGLETVRPATFVDDLQGVLDVAADGFTSFWIPDHLQFSTKYRLECWSVLTWIAARYPQTQVGTIVLANSFRQPALLAKMAATVQTLSNGRLILGYGAGWHAEEYEAYGYPYPSPAVRVDMMEEGIKVIQKLWTEAPANFEGTYYQLREAYCEPQPNPLPTLMIGGGGEQRTLRLVARYADWWNDVARPLPILERKLRVLREHCVAEGRDYDSIRKTYMVRVYIDRSHKRALEMAGDAFGGETAAIAGDPVAVREQFEVLAGLGIDLFQVLLPGFPETDDMRLFVDEVVSAFR